MRLTRRQFTLATFAGGTALTLPGCVTVPWLAPDDGPARATPPPGAPPATGGVQPELAPAFGGEYADPRLQGYVGDVGARLAAHTGHRYPYRFTVLDTAIVNAFATPHGAVYVSRGLLSLAGDEAELAGVLAHQLGHVVAGHAARRHAASTSTVPANRAVPEALRDLPADIVKLGGAARDPAGLAVQAHSQAAESRADALGAHYLGRAGYRPDAMASLLATLRAHGALAARSPGLAGGASHMLATHPRGLDQLRGAIAAAGTDGTAQAPAHDVYLEHIDGLLFGDDPANGIARGRRFVHPGLRYRLDAPPGFTVRTARTRVLASDGSGRAVVHDVAATHGARDTFDYLVGHWATGMKLHKLTRTTVNGAAAATAISFVRDDAGAPLEIRLVVVQRDSRNAYRLMFLSPPTDGYDWEMETVRSTYSLQPLAADEATTAAPLRVRIERADGRTVAELAARLPYGARNDAWFRMLNRIAPGAEPRADQVIKVIAA